MLFSGVNIQVPVVAENESKVAAMGAHAESCAKGTIPARPSEITREDIRFICEAKMAKVSFGLQGR